MTIFSKIVLRRQIISSHRDEKFLNARSSIDFLKAAARELRYRQDNEKVQK